MIVERSECRLGTNYAIKWGSPHSAYIQFYGRLHEPLKGISQASLQVSLDEELEARDDQNGVGGIIAVKPSITCVINTTLGHFDRLWQLAFCGACRSVYLSCDVPKRGKALIHSWSASTGLPEDE
ncbi:hypothetical protein SLNSH_06170 [Alsobacter soli]|uniref:Uncharacterized protein n=1 Tax=Alsobacter soli TaxID=2109933 RepID=A0A2T1HWK5_9HYPH|nr:hypothetical protein [Alsobacter soli]PSC05958.1 hypothetical protein SLNSH_06170 [Alsobacter soli]